MTERRYDIKVRVAGKWENRSVTLAEFRADLDARAKMTAPIMDAFRRGDIAGVENAQKAMRAVYK